ncbi:MAG: adenosylmethionine--8-amino-7-oxononanoate transaminase [Pseudomonadota bacterium]
MIDISLQQQKQIDTKHIWHPYSAMHSEMPVFHVDSAKGVKIRLSDGQELIDGMASWWCAIHGYNHPELNQAVNTQLDKMSHVMFGGLTHEPAIRLSKNLVDMTPESLTSVFISDSGSVSVEVALKMAVQYWHAKGVPNKQKFVTIRNGYHGDTLGAMSVCDPVTGMHGLFNSILSQQFFADRPATRFEEAFMHEDIQPLETLVKENHADIAALILEPIVQGAGGMYFYSPDYLAEARKICDRYDILLIADEIATGFGRSGKLFAVEHAGIEPDIMCLGKSLTGGYMSLAATITNDKVSTTIDEGNPGVFMHGPTFMANPLACSIANASIDLLIRNNWADQVSAIESRLKHKLKLCADLEQVAEVRVLGAIGVVELKKPVNMATISQQFVDAGVWIRPFGKLVYLMPPYVISQEELDFLCEALATVVSAQPV